MDLQLQALSTDGAPIEQAEVGRPFMLEVVVRGTNGSTKKPNIIGTQLFEVGQTNYHMSSINGKTTISYTYHVMIDKKGEYKIGPAEITDKSERFRSRPLNLKVGETEIEKNGDKKRKTTKKVLLQFFSDKTDVVIGQKVRCFLRFYYLDSEVVELDRIISPDIKDVHQTQKEGAYTGSKKANDTIYNYLEYRWDIYPKVVGEITLPASRADFTIRIDDGFFRGFASLFNLGVQKKYVYSNALTLQVDPLPPYDGVVDAVGDFSKFDSYVDRALARQGDGIVLTLEIEGDGDLENLDITEIQDMPHTIKYYFSKSYITDKDSGLDTVKKKFEFIIQGLEPGEWEIPKQKFTYFDVKSRSYKTLKTSSILLKILPQPILKSPKTKGPDMEVLTIKDDITPINKIGNWYAQKQREIPFWIFIILIMVPLLVIGFSWVKNLLVKYSNRYAPHMLKKKAFKNACNRLHVALSKKDLSMLYSIFIKLFSERFEMQEHTVTQEFMLRAMQESGFEKDEITSWEDFFSEISSFTFYDKATFEKKPFDEAKDWIERFKNKL